VFGSGTAPSRNRGAPEAAPVPLGLQVLLEPSGARHMAEAWHEDWMLAVVGSSLAALGILLALARLYAAVSLARLESAQKPSGFRTSS
jgi:hypothetical protein